MIEAEMRKMLGHVAEVRAQFRDKVDSNDPDMGFIVDMLLYLHLEQGMKRVAELGQQAHEELRRYAHNHPDVRRRK
jgi:hypothetical protein